MKKWLPWLLFWSLALFGAAFVSIPVGWVLLVQPFRIPQASMAPTLEPGAYVLGWKRDPQPKKGDLLVFRFPRAPKIKLVKRVVAVGGETISIEDNRIVIDGEPVPFEEKGDMTYFDSSCRQIEGTRYATKSGDVEYDVVITGTGVETLRNMGELEVPEGHFFVIGDNRDNSEDSRIFGTITPDHVVAVATKFLDGPSCE